MWRSLKETIPTTNPNVATLKNVTNMYDSLDKLDEKDQPPDWCLWHFERIVAFISLYGKKVE